MAPNTLCLTCKHCKLVVSAKGSRFMLCQLSLQDGRYVKYPPQPVVACRGYAPAEGVEPTS
ncbi:MAG: hypothetical protein NXI22_04510 [bacterium]|nr:hypothetical protein [bacterium]